LDFNYKQQKKENKMDILKKIGLYLDEENGDKEEYKAFFEKMLKKFGVSSPDELEGDKKKEFFDAIDKGWKGDDEADKDESLKEESLKEESSSYYSRELMHAGTKHVTFQVSGEKGKSKWMNFNEESKKSLIDYLKKVDLTWE
jgi:hypothetical protein